MAALAQHEKLCVLLPAACFEHLEENWQVLPSRPRRNRRSPTIRGAISETHIAPANLILPVFIHDGEQNLPIASMPGVDRLGWRHGLLDSVAEARSVGVNSVVLFPKARRPASGLGGWP